MDCFSSAFQFFGGGRLWSFQDLVTSACFRFSTLKTLEVILVLLVFVFPPPRVFSVATCLALGDLSSVSFL